MNSIPYFNCICLENNTHGLQVMWSTYKYRKESFTKITGNHQHIDIATIKMLWSHSDYVFALTQKAIPYQFTSVSVSCDDVVHHNWIGFVAKWKLISLHSFFCSFAFAMRCFVMKNCGLTVYFASPVITAGKHGVW